MKAEEFAESLIQWIKEFKETEKLEDLIPVAKRYPFKNIDYTKLDELETRVLSKLAPLGILESVKEHSKRHGHKLKDYKPIIQQAL